MQFTTSYLDLMAELKRLIKRILLMVHRVNRIKKNNPFIGECGPILLGGQAFDPPPE